jgi:glutamyl-tRNA synthetase
VALCGTTAAPGVHEVMEVLGKERTLERLRQAGEFLKRQA